MSTVHPWRVVVAGGGVAGVEALLGLAALGGGRLQLALVTPGNHFVLHPHAVGEPFGLGPAPSLPMADVARDAGARFVRDRVARVRADAMAVDLEGGRELPYDALVLAVGSRRRPAHPAALTFGGPEDVPAVRRLVGDLTHRRAVTVAFVVPEDATWPLPAYELALMTRGRAQRRRFILLTPEPTPLSLFGPEPSREIAELLGHAGIEVHAGAAPGIAEDGRAVRSGPDAPWIPVDRVVTLPVVDGPRLDGVPHEARGFIPVDDHCRVRGLERVYAAGDGTDAPVKQGGLATQQAYAAVRHLVAEAGGSLPAEPFRPVLRGRLITGGLDRYLRHDPDRGDAFLTEPLWEPAAKVVGHHLAPYLAYRHPELWQRRTDEPAVRPR